MSIFTIGDLHLSLDADKNMEIFPGWENYMERLCLHWKQCVRDGDTVVLAGDISWGMTLQSALKDFILIDSLPGRKILIKGNHDYWWSTRAKMEGFFERNALRTLEILHNSAVPINGAVLCGSRGWMFEKGEPHDRKIVLREAQRLELSLKAAAPYEGERIAFLHYPPVYADQASPDILEVLRAYGVRRCYYGHIHSAGCAWAVNGPFMGIEFQLISADYLHFCPKPVPIDTNESYE